MADTKIRIAAPDDAAQLLDIYAPYVEKTAVSFEYTVPDLKEFADRITRILEDYPWLIAERNGKAAGYAYAGRFKDPVPHYQVPVSRHIPPECCVRYRDPFRNVLIRPGFCLPEKTALFHAEAPPEKTPARCP